MKKSLFILFLTFTFKILLAQDSVEYYFKFSIQDRSELKILTKTISIDNVKGNEVFAFANQQQFDAFVALGYKWELIQEDSPKSLSMATTVSEMANWDKYPTYEVYRQMLKNFETNYPTICKLDSIGTTVQGRKLYVLKISDNVNTNESEPEFFYTSTMHGDETTGFILMLRLADSLLNSYETVSEISNLVNNIEIYINPDANPDGTYYGGNNTVSNSRRYNANGVDINRDFPDPRVGANKPYQPETQAMMDFAESRHFMMSANFHGGVEVMNYPWDAWTEGYPDYKPHPDSEWFKRICTNYVSTARLVNPNYMKDVYSSGITNGGDWYVVEGGRQDYMNYWHQCREVTIELSSVKLLATENLNNYWNYNKQSLLDYIHECTYGIHGTVKNIDGDPINAMIVIEGHDIESDSTMVFTDFSVGDYHRPIEAGTYDVIASSKGYASDTIKNVVVTNENTSNIDFVLEKEKIASETNPKFILDTLNQDENKDYKIVIKNIGTETLNYTLNIESSTETNTWVSISKDNGTIEPNLTDTVIANITSLDLIPGDYSCAIKVIEINGNNYLLPIDIHVNQIQAILKIENISDFKVYPNPFSNQITIEFISKKDNQVTLRIFDVCGNNKFQKEISCTLNTKNRFSLNDFFNTESLQKGIYFIQISAGDRELTKKLLKQ